MLFKHRDDFKMEIEEDCETARPRSYLNIGGRYNFFPSGVETTDNNCSSENLDSNITIRQIDTVEDQSLESIIAHYSIENDVFPENDHCIKPSTSEGNLYSVESNVYKETSYLFDLDTSTDSTKVELSNVSEKGSSAKIDDSDTESVVSEVEKDEGYLSSDDEQDSFRSSVSAEINSGENENEVNEELEINSITRKRTSQPQNQLTRKRMRYPEKWKKNITKKATNLGLEYESLSTKKIVRAKCIKRSCGPGCRFQCESKVSEEARFSFFTDFWSIEDHSRKYDFIARHVSEITKRISKNEKSKRKYSKVYNINCRNINIPVCQTMFLNTLDISKQMVETALKKLRSGDEVLADNRGKSKTTVRVTSEEKTLNVIEHINMFPRVESHYTRKSSNREYLEESLSLNRMYSMYLEWTTETGKIAALKHHYVDTFNTKFNIGFFKPKKDQCDQCEGFKNASEANKNEIKEQYQKHLDNKIKSRELKEIDKIESKNDTSCIVFFNFQKVLATPKTEASSLYYRRKLSVFNFTIYDIVRHEAFCYIWSENDAKKDSNEVASCLLDFIEKKVSEGITNFNLWSDNCAGQNRNKNVFAMYVYAACKYKINIKYSFLEVGHTQNEGDSVHATIERYSKGRKIYTLNEWCDIITSAKLTSPHYQVINVTFDKIYDLKHLAAQQNWVRTATRKGKESSTLRISNVKQVFASKDILNQILYKNSFEEDFHIHVTRKQKEHVNVNKYTLVKAYTSVQGLQAAKIKDLKSLCKSNIIPPQYHDYYYAFPERSHSTQDCISDEENE